MSQTGEAKGPSSGAELFVARQPIFTANGEVHAYELLFRSGTKNYFDAVNPEMATSSVVNSTISVLGMERMTGGKPAFINFTRELLVKGLATLMSPNTVVVELLETIEPEAEVLDACRDLKNRGYTLALDDFVYDHRFEPLMALADIIKVDFLMSDERQRLELARRARRRSIRLLAEKVETDDEFSWAKEHGYELFQGYFFARPTVLQGRDIPSWKIAGLRLLKEVQQAEMDYDRIHDLVQLDVSLSYKLLRYINSPYFSRRSTITSIKQALALLGESNIRKWVSVATISAMAQDRPTELVRLSLVRALFCESLAPDLHRKADEAGLFMIGLFSLLEAVLQRPLAEILTELPLPDVVLSALTKGSGPLAPALKLAVAWEKANWQEVNLIVTEMKLDGATLAERYLETISRVQNILQL